uniref:Uncharacterized protein n=1 Tax=Anguilla anguilla TaxID=7936 RepID=A0A0E9PE27_ANGAN
MGVNPICIIFRFGMDMRFPFGGWKSSLCICHFIKKKWLPF